MPGAECTGLPPPATRAGVVLLYCHYTPDAYHPQNIQLDENDVPPESYAHSVLNKSRIPEICVICWKIQKDYVFSA